MPSPSEQTDYTVFTVLSGAELFPTPPPNSVDAAVWTPVIAAIVDPGDSPLEGLPPEGERYYVAPNTTPPFSNAGATKGSRVLKFEIGGDSVDTNGAQDANVFIFVVQAPDGITAELPVNGQLPTITAQLSAAPAATIAESADIAAMGPVLANILTLDGVTGVITCCITLNAVRPDYGAIQVTVDFGYSASN